MDWAKTTARRETFMFWDWVCLILENWRYLFHCGLVIIWHQTSWSAFVHEMTRCMLGTKPLPEPMLNYCQLDPKEHTSMIFFFWGRGSQIFIQENQFENVVCCKLLIIVLRPGWVNSLTSGRGGNNFEAFTFKSFFELIFWQLLIKLFSGGCQTTKVMVSQHWFR